MNAPTGGWPPSLVPSSDLRRVLEVISTPCLILDPRLNIVAANDAYLRETMIQAPDILGRPIFEVFPDHPGDVNGLGVSVWRASRERVSATRQQDPMPVQRSANLFDSGQNLLCQQIGRTGSFEWDIATNEVHWSAEFAALYGFGLNAFTSSYDTWRESIYPVDLAAFERLVAEAFNARNSEAEWRVSWPDGTVRWLAGRAMGYRDESGRPQRMLGVNIDITDRKAAEEMTHRAAQHDSLTGLPNRTLLYEYANHVLPAMHRGNSHAAFLFIDLDHFKLINDTHGHDVGDIILKMVAARLTDRLRGEDFVARLGGDEFVAVLAHIHGEEDAAMVARHFLDHLSRPYLTAGVELQLSPSIGISLYPENGDAVDELIKRADMAMYAAKKCGRNNFQFFRP